MNPIKYFDINEASYIMHNLDHSINLPKVKPLTRGYYDSIRTESKIGRNDLCPCGSSKKYKKCCQNENN